MRADVGAAVADEDADPGFFLGDVLLFGWIDPFFGEVAAAVVEHLADLGARTAGGEDRFGDVDGTLEGAGYEDAGPFVSMGFVGSSFAKLWDSSSMPILLRKISWTSFGGFMPMERTTMSNSSSLTPSSGVEYRTVTFLVTGSSLTMDV